MANLDNSYEVNYKGMSFMPLEGYKTDDIDLKPKSHQSMRPKKMTLNSPGMFSSTATFTAMND